MSHSPGQMIKAHVPVLIDYIGLATAIALIVYSSETFVADRPSSIFGVVYASLVIGHFLVPVSRRTPILYGVLLILGIISTFYFAFDTVKPQCGWQVLVGKPGDLHLIPPKKGQPPVPWVNCEDVAGAWWLNLILTLYVDFVFAVSLLQRNSHGRIRLPDTEPESGAADA